MSCTQCGAQLAAGQRVCHVCGAAVVPSSTAPATGRSQMKAATTLVVVGIVAVLLALGLLWIALRQQRTEPTAISQVTPESSGTPSPTAPPPTAVQPTPPSARWLVFSSERDDDLEIYAVQADGANLTRLTNNPGMDSSPIWSPDGRKIAFISRRAQNNLPSLWIMNADGSEPLNLITDEPIGGDHNPSWRVGSFHFPDWSPDGQRLVAEVTVQIKSGSSFKTWYDIFVVNSDGTSVTNITSRRDPWDSLPAWSPDGSRIAFNSHAEGSYNWDIYTVRPDGTELVQLTHHADTESEYFDSWSPDGTQIAYQRSADLDGDGNKDGSAIWVMNADGSQAAPLTDGSSMDRGAIWSPDGQRIAFASNRDGVDEVYVMSTDGSDLVRLTASGDGRGSWPDSWSPDGQQIAFTQQEGDTNGDGIIDWSDHSEVWVMRADGSGQTNVSNNPNGHDREPDWKP